MNDSWQDVGRAHIAGRRDGIVMSDYKNTETKDPFSNKSGLQVVASGTQQLHNEKNNNQDKFFIVHEKMGTAGEHWLDD